MSPITAFGGGVGTRAARERSPYGGRTNRAGGEQLITRRLTRSDRTDEWGAGPPERGTAPHGEGRRSGQLWFQVTLKLLPPDRAEVVALVVPPEAMLILSGP